MAESTFNNPSSFGAFAPTTNVWDVGEIYAADIDPNIKEIMVRLYQNLNLMSILLNLKDTGFYDLSEFVNGQLFFPNQTATVTTFDTSDSLYRQVYRTVIDFGALPNTGTKSVAHGITITPQTSFTRIYATASDQTNLAYIPIPYASPVLVNNVELKVDATNVTIITGSNRSSFNVTYVVLEYLQS